MKKIAMKKLLMKKIVMKKMLKKIVCIVSVVICLFMTGCTQKADEGEAKNRLDAIRERGYIEVATEPAFAPFEFADPQKEGNDKYQGSDIEFAKYIAEKLGVELRIVPLEFSAVLAGVAEGKYDLAMSALAYTPEREKAMILSKGYYFAEDSAGHGLIIREEDAEKIQNVDDLADKVLSFQSGSLQELLATEQIPSSKEIKRVSSSTDAYLMVQENKADVAVSNIDLAQLYIAANPNSGLMVASDFRFEIGKEYDGTRIGIPLGEVELEEFINSAIDEVLESGEYEKWYLEAKEYAMTLGL